jgi:hypothetical protein
VRAKDCQHDLPVLRRQIDPRHVSRRCSSA